MISWEILGLRDAAGRYASIAYGGMAAIANEEATQMAAELEALYQRAAPRSNNNEPGHVHFADGLHAEFKPGSMGFEGGVTTDNPKLRDIIKFGHKAFAINAAYSKKGYHGVLHWTGGKYGAGDHFARYVFIPAHAGNAWEDEVAAAADAMITERGRRIFDIVRMRL